MTHALKSWPITTRPMALLCIFFAACLAPILPASAEESGISVSGVGVAKGKPTMVEIGAKLSGDGELAADASVKYNDLKKKAIAALEALKDPNLTLEFTGPVVGLATDAAAQMRVMQGNPGGDTVKQKVEISEQVRLILKNADQLEPDKLIAIVLKVLDTAKDAGLQVGNVPTNYIQMQIRAQTGQGGDSIVVFKIPDRTELESQAYEKAVADARAKAERIAKLSGVKLGRIAYVGDQGAAQDPNSQQSLLAMIYGSGAATPAPETKEVESSSLTDIPVTVRLTVRFDIEKP